MSTADPQQALAPKCSDEVLKYLRASHEVTLHMEQIARGIEQRMTRVETNNQAIIDMLSEKLDELVDALRGKDMMPTSSLRWIIIYLIIFSFTVTFGQEVTRDFLRSLIHG